MRRSVMISGLVLLLALALLGAAPTAGAVGERATGTLVNSAGQEIGTVELQQTTATNVSITVQYGNIPAGEHGIHFHAVSRCDGPDFMSAGGDYNPTSRQHGFNNPEGAHAGDLENLVTDASTAQQSGYLYRTTTQAVTLTAGSTSLFDADGTALVIHANADDYATDPAGNSGGRIACAVLTQAAPGMPNTGAGALAQRPAWSGAIFLATLTLLLTFAVARLARRRA